MTSSTRSCAKWFFRQSFQNAVCTHFSFHKPKSPHDTSWSYSLASSFLRPLNFLLAAAQLCFSTCPQVLTTRVLRNFHTRTQKIKVLTLWYLDISKKYRRQRCWIEWQQIFRQFTTPNFSGNLFCYCHSWILVIFCKDLLATFISCAFCPYWRQWTWSGLFLWVIRGCIWHRPSSLYKTLFILRVSDVSDCASSVEINNVKTVLKQSHHI